MRRGMRRGRGGGKVERAERMQGAAAAAVGEAGNRARTAPAPPSPLPPTQVTHPRRRTSAITACVRDGRCSSSTANRSSVTRTVPRTPRGRKCAAPAPPSADFQASSALISSASGEDWEGGWGAEGAWEVEEGGADPSRSPTTASTVCLTASASRRCSARPCPPR